MGWFASISSYWLKTGFSNGRYIAPSAPAADLFGLIQSSRPNLPARKQGEHTTLDAQPPTSSVSEVLTMVKPAPTTPLPARERNQLTLKMRSRHERLTGGAHPKNAVRLVISGRMADVCAELERLAANEARLYNTVLH